MNIQRASHLARRNLLFTQIASIALITPGSLVLIGWQLQIEGLKSILPGLFSIDPNSAAGILLRGAALSLLLPQGAKKAFHFLASSPAMVVTTLGLLLQREYFLGEKRKPEVYGISRKISFQERV